MSILTEVIRLEAMAKPNPDASKAFTISMAMSKQRLIEDLVLKTGLSKSAVTVSLICEGLISHLNEPYLRLISIAEQHMEHDANVLLEENSEEFQAYCAACSIEEFEFPSDSKENVLHVDPYNLIEICKRQMDANRKRVMG